MLYPFANAPPDEGIAVFRYYLSAFIPNSAVSYENSNLLEVNGPSALTVVIE
jgi:hypothetical protein